MDRTQRLYLDNAATSFPKPPAVLEAMKSYATTLGASAGRGAYAEAIETGQLLAECRRRINRLINGQRPEHVIFTLNCSDALNLAIKGLIDSTTKAHAICTHIDHNSILRPLNALEERGAITQTRITVDPVTGLVDPDDIRGAIRPNTRLIAITHVSNVTGAVQPIRQIGRIAREREIPFVVDAAQSLGHVPIDVREDAIDLLAAPGHKALLGPLGTGFLYIRPGMERRLSTLREGGTGSVSEQDTQPDFLPDKYEPGSHNAIGIIGLSEGVAWVMDQTVEKLAAHDRSLLKVFLDDTDNVDGLTCFGPPRIEDRVGVISIRVDGLEPQELAAVLESSFGILTRAGLHCAPLAHQSIGTLNSGGTTRLSFGPFVTVKDVKYAAEALRQIALSKPISQQTTSTSIG
ncbi:MAG TPA: aminotransferase class V-fold PLP-dependent enzyme [Tepidisphaeraceae bacterium]|nr:aminotransferase class V-fold PLP-dependent enzyme [Tepidisphaeraceae bacterium]